MPQDFPVEASERLAFTPPSLSALPNPPTFMLRPATLREKRARTRMLREEGVVQHATTELRAEALRGLKAKWTGEQYDTFSAYVTDYWRALDEFELQAKDDPDLVFEFDEEIAGKVRALIGRLEREWPPMMTMLADNEEAGSLVPLSFLAVIIDEGDGKHLTLEACDRIAADLRRLDAAARSEPNTAFLELYAACLKRFVIDEEEVGNSESPSPSETSPSPSSETSTSAKGGKSRASAHSSKTRESA